MLLLLLLLLLLFLFLLLLLLLLMMMMLLLLFLFLNLFPPSNKSTNIRSPHFHASFVFTLAKFRHEVRSHKGVPRVSIVQVVHDVCFIYIYIYIYIYITFYERASEPVVLHLVDVLTTLRLCA